MSIYSGFPTRKDQSTYNSLLSKLITLMQTHLLEALGENIQTKMGSYSKIIVKLRQFQQHKYLPPKFSQLLKPLCIALGISSGQEKNIDDGVTTELVPFGGDKTKMSSHSLSKYRLKGKAEFDIRNEIRDKKVSFYQNKFDVQNVKRQKQEESSKDLNSKKLVRIPQRYGPKINDFRDEQKLNESRSEKESFHHVSNQPGNLVMKYKNNIKYRAAIALNQVHDNLQKRQKINLQRKKLKTEEHSRDNQTG